MAAKKQKYLIKTKYGNFYAKIWFDRADKAYLVEVPSFDNAPTFGSSLADAKYMAKDLIELLALCAFDEGKLVVDDERHIFARRASDIKSGPLAKHL